MLNFRKKQKVNIGTIIENKRIDSSTNQISIRIINFTYSPNEGNLYLISFGGLTTVRKKTYYLALKNIPDENNILSFDLKNTKLLDELNIGEKVKIQGPFTHVIKKAC